MKLVTFEHDGKTYAVLDDKGLPLYELTDGKQVGYDAVSLTTKIGQLNNESKGHREAKEQLEAKLAPFEGIEDPAAAKLALETIANIDAGKLVEAGKVQEIRDQAKKAAEEAVANTIKAKDVERETVVKERDGLQLALNNELIGGNFSRSKYIADKVAIPADLVQAKFGGNFKVEDGKLVAYDAQGNKVLSRAADRYMEPASFEEAIEQLITDYPDKAKILAGEVSGGGGAGGGAGGGGSGKKVTRAEFGRMSPTEQAIAGRAAAAGTLQIVDT